MSHSHHRIISRASICLTALLGALFIFNRPAMADEPRHEKIDKAKEVLKDAYRDLDKAADDFGGHKKEAMEKISDAVHSLDKWHDNVSEATDKVDKALEQLHICKDKSREHHPKIEEAIDALVAAKDELAAVPVAEPRHEKIDKAKDALRDAYADLDHAADNFGGHKKEAMEKISEASKSLEKWHDNIHEATEKVDKALEQLHICKDKSREHHPKIEEAIDALEAAKDELK